ncbi:MAG: PIN domain-containing protein [Candidatus Thermoplasmatota archaeon]|nr:PIN domain-containing protein [Candidatus Thermoplasmatota archaeon]
MLIDTMEILNLLTNPGYKELKAAIDDHHVKAEISAVSFTEIYKILGKTSEKEAIRIIREIIASDLSFREADYRICVKAGEIRLHYDIPTIDALIAATGIMSNATHILTTDPHFQTIKKIIKPVTMKEIKKMVK